MTNEEQRREWLRLMIEISLADRAKYRELRAEAWGYVIRDHQDKTMEQLEVWLKDAS